MRNIRRAKRLASRSDTYAKRCILYLILCVAALADAAIVFFKDTESGHIFLMSWGLVALAGVAAAVGYSECAGAGIIFAVLANAAAFFMLLDI